jgi:DNA-binding NtrC family response regulator
MRSAMVISTVADDITAIRSALGPGFRFSTTGDVPSALQTLDRKRYELIFVDLDILSFFSATCGLDAALHAFQQRNPTIEVVIMTPPAQIRLAVGWVKAGARDYISYPVSHDEVKLVAESIAKSILRQSELDYLRDQFWKTDALEMVQTKSMSMVEVYKKIRSVAATKTTVLLVGETGTGKGVLAKLVHQHSNRQNAQFISVHCGAIPDTLLESELFGHEKGAFTGAVRKKLGKFEIANGGTIFLDEIGTLTPSAQIKLLQVLQDGSFSRVGGEETIHTNARVIAATNADLKTLCECGQFRKDLYYRLNVFPIEIPPLRHRVEDLPRLIDVFLKRLNREFQKAVHSVDPRVVEGLARYDWPGNVRELENLMERAYILENSTILTHDSFPQELFETQCADMVAPYNDRLPLSAARKQALEDFERQYLKGLVTRNQGRINISAAEAGISTRQLHKLMTKYGIHKEAFKNDRAVH